MGRRRPESERLWWSRCNRPWWCRSCLRSATASGVSSSTASWLVTSTLLTGAVATPLIGRLADMFGKRAMMLVCLAVMIVGCMVAALSQSFWLLILGRSLQGFATALLPVGISIMRDVLPPEKLSGAVALMSATLGIGGMCRYADGWGDLGALGTTRAFLGHRWVRGSTDSRLAAGGAGIGCEESRTLRLSGGHGPHTRYDCTAAGRFERNRMGLGKPPRFWF